MSRSMNRPPAEQTNAKKQKIESSPEAQLELLITKQEAINEIDKELAEKIAQLTREYNARKAPVYIERQRVINEIPKFWKRVILSWQEMEGLLHEHEETAFNFLNEVDVQLLDLATDSYRIVFTFSPNPYFKNTELWKSVEVSSLGKGNEDDDNDDEEEQDQDGQVFKLNASGIEWKSTEEALALKSVVEAGVVQEEEETDTSPQASILALFYPEDTNTHLAEAIRAELWPDPVGIYHEVLNMQVEVDDEDDA